MIVTYLTDDNVLVSVCHVGFAGPGEAKWQACVEGMGGMARWSVSDLAASPAWSAERVARHALEWAQSLPDSGKCPCPDPDCPGKEGRTAKDVFGPSDPNEVKLTGPWFDHEEAVVAAAVQAGYLDDEDAAEHLDEPTIEELIADLDGKPRPPKPGTEPPDPFKGSTWRLG